MAQPYFRDEPATWRAPRRTAPFPETRFIAAANIIAGWLYEIAGPFFWAAIVMILVLSATTPR